MGAFLKQAGSFCDVQLASGLELLLEVKGDGREARSGQHWNIVNQSQGVGDLERAAPFRCTKKASLRDIGGLSRGHTVH